MNYRRPWHQRLLWRISRQFPLDGLTLNSPLLILGGLHLLGALVACLGALPIVALILSAAACGCLTCQLRRNAAQAFPPASPVRITPSHDLHHRHHRHRQLP